MWAFSGEMALQSRARTDAWPLLPRGVASQPPVHPLSLLRSSYWLAGSAGIRTLRRGAEDPHVRVWIRAQLSGHAGFACIDRAYATGSHRPWRGLRWLGAALSDTWVAPGSRLSGDWPTPPVVGIPG